MFRSLVTDLFRYGKVITTETKAKRARTFADHIVTLGREGTLHARRQALAFLYDESVVDKVFTEVAPRVAAVENKRGGYTRVIKVGLRAGDGAPVAILELALD